MTPCSFWPCLATSIWTRQELIALVSLQVQNTVDQLIKVYFHTYFLVLTKFSKYHNNDLNVPNQYTDLQLRLLFSILFLREAAGNLSSTKRAPNKMKIKTKNIIKFKDNKIQIQIQSPLQCGLIQVSQWAMHQVQSGCFTFVAPAN